MNTRKVYVINTSQSRRLIAKGIVGLPQIQDALKNGKIFIARGSTNAYVLEELYQAAGIMESFNKADYVMGQIIPGKNFMEWGINKGKQIPEIIIEKGKKREIKDRVQEIYKFRQGDIIIKGGNALDINGVPGVLVGGASGGGTIGSIVGTIIAKGVELICPIGLEKLILQDMNDLSSVMGIENMQNPSLGMPCGIFPMPFATTITEIEAIELLFDCEAYHVASGGVGGAEGSVSLLIDCFEEESYKKIDLFMQEIANEPKYVPNLTT